MGANTNPPLEDGFCTTGIKNDIPETLRLLGLTPENPILDGRVVNKIFNMIFENLNHQKKKGFAFWQTDSYYEATENNMDICRRNNQIYFCIQTHNETGEEPKAPETNPDYWRLFYDLDKPLVSTYALITHDHDSKYAKLSGNKLEKFKVADGEDDDEAINKKQLEALISAIISIPAGTVIQYASPNPPDGYIKCNGYELSRTVYSRLFNAIGTTFGAGDGSTTFNIPDLRGVWARAWDDGRGIDPFRVFGSYQEDSYLNHSHAASSSTAGAHTHGILGGNANTGTNRGNTSSNTNYTIPTNSAGDHTHTITVNASTTGSTETRPKNIALLYCIKY